METTIKGEHLRDMFLEGQEYSKQELDDIFSQLVLEQTKAEQELTVFKGRVHEVKRASFNNIIAMNRNLARFDKLKYAVDVNKWYFRIPILGGILLRRNDAKTVRVWKDICRSVFVGDVSDFEFGELTRTEFERVLKIFFRFRAVSSQDAPGKLEGILNASSKGEMESKSLPVMP